MPLLQAEAAAAQSVSLPSSHNSSRGQSLHELVPEQQDPPEEQTSTSSEQQNPSDPSPVEQEEEPAVEYTGPEDMLDIAFIGRTIKLVRAENWEQDIIPTIPQETRILYENQRGYANPIQN